MTSSPMLVLVTGSRTWSDRDPIRTALERALAKHPMDLTVVEGGARGADRIAWEWTRDRRKVGVGSIHYPASWNEHHPDWCPSRCSETRNFCMGAGPRRNQEMLDYIVGSGEIANGYFPAKVLAFKLGLDLSGHGGTEDMVRRSLEAGVPVFHYDARWHVLEPAGGTQLES